jgi:hypothetical protein
MDNATLVARDLDAGKQLIRALDMAGLDVKAAFWLHLEEADGGFTPEGSKEGDWM